MSIREQIAADHERARHLAEINPRPLPTGVKAEAGLPRPLGVVRQPGRVALSPVPWSQDTISEPEEIPWGIGDLDRLSEAVKEGLCLLCGEEVDEGSVIASRSSTDPIPEHFTMDNIDHDAVFDKAPLHHHCLKATLAHCPHFRDSEEEISVLPFFRRSPGA